MLFSIYQKAAHFKTDVDMLAIYVNSKSLNQKISHQIDLLLALILEILPNAMKNEIPLLEIKNLSKYFPIRSGLLMKETARINAVSDVSFSIKKGQTLGLVGESGWEKYLRQNATQAYRAHWRTDIFEGNDITHLGSRAMKAMRRQMQIIFQDPMHLY